MSRPQEAAGRRHCLYGETEPRSCILRWMDRIPLRFALLGSKAVRPSLLEIGRFYTQLPKGWVP